MIAKSEEWMLGRHKQQMFTILIFVDQGTERLSGCSVLYPLHDKNVSKGLVDTIERARVLKRI